MAPPLNMHQVDFGDDEINAVLYRETDKKARAILESSDADIIAFDTSSDFVTKHIFLNGTVFVDFCNGIFGNKFSDISFERIPDFEGYERLEADSSVFRELYIQRFDELYSAILQKKLEAGSKVVVLCQNLCNFHLAEGVLSSWGGEWVEERRRLQASIESFLSSYPGVELLKVDDRMSVTSKSSPWGGPWEFHPEREFYLLAALGLLRIINANAQEQNDFLVEWLARNARERDALTSERDAARSAIS